ncbi:MAG: glutamate formimidoyltransferase [Anaerolineales bacterium]
MTSSLVECVPNFSDGRRAEVVDEILDSIRRIAGAFVLDWSSDPDHNRTVVTIAGNPNAMEEAAFSAVSCAASRIDLRIQRGVHARIGATDVVPFIPLVDFPMEDCVALARRLGRRIGDELGLPVYLYAQAATRPERKDLTVIRKGQFEELAATIGKDPARAPDFGPARIGPAGATAVGARGPLVAFNVYLETADVEIARKVARRIRTSSGGLPELKALGLPVAGQAQVSMNLTDYTRTSLKAAFEAVRTEAEILGVQVDRSELIGLMPRNAMRGIDPAELRLENFSEEKFLERRLKNTGLMES